VAVPSSVTSYSWLREPNYFEYPDIRLEMNNTDLLIGFGEVGQAIHSIFGERREIAMCDPPKGLILDAFAADWMHIAIPYTDEFIPTVVEYTHMYTPKHIIIHSTVPVGTTRKVERQSDYIPTYFSPIRGRHPNLARAIRDFPKWYSSPLPGQADEEIEVYYATAGIQTRRAPSHEFLEWAKLLETFTYGYNLVMWQEIERQAAKIPGNKQANLSTLKNWLYEKRKCYDGDLGVVPIYDLVPGPIGGHCVTENWTLLEPMMDPDLYNWLVKSNGLRKP